MFSWHRKKNLLRQPNLSNLFLYGPRQAHGEAQDERWIYLTPPRPWTRQATGPVGMVNLTATCYLETTLQEPQKSQSRVASSTRLLSGRPNGQGVGTHLDQSARRIHHSQARNLTQSEPNEYSKLWERIHSFSSHSSFRPLIVGERTRREKTTTWESRGGNNEEDINCVGDICMIYSMNRKTRQNKNSFMVEIKRLYPPEGTELDHGLQKYKISTFPK